jgi:site-specific DNA-methyltransferase (adenine-specific)
MGKAPPNLNDIGTPSKIETSDEPWIPSDFGRFPSNVLGEIPDYQKYFYCPKVSRKERHIGFDQLPESEPLNSPDQVRNHPLWDPSIGTNAHRLKEKIRQVNGEVEGKGNNHPTVKPIELMKYLIKLITPPGGTVLDPFNGSGSTGCAAVELGHTYIGCELDPKYVEIARKRIEAWYKSTLDPAKDLFDDN